MSDIENTTISVKTLVVIIWAVVGTLLMLEGWGCYYWFSATAALRDHGVKIDAMVANQKGISDQLGQAHEDRVVVEAALKQEQAEIDAISKRIDGYRPYKWSVIMEKQYNDDLKSKNPGLVVPDPLDIQKNTLPYTP